MNKNIWIIVGLVVVISIGYWWVSTNKDDTPSTDTTENNITEQKSVADEKTSTENTAQEAIVTYGSNGFSPATITIKKGQTVTFKNESGKSMWVASENHPSHLIYPEFDAKDGTSSGSSYEFTFDKIGTWNYHDHLSSGRTGIIIVE